MGVRLRNAANGRFLSTYPVPAGSANVDEYADQDPINTFDLDGRCWDHPTCCASRVGNWWSGTLQRHAPADVAHSILVLPVGSYGAWSGRSAWTRLRLRHVRGRRSNR